MPIHGYLGGVISATAPSVTTAGASGVFTLEEQLQASAQNNWPGYQISRSVRIRSSASAYFNRTLSTPTNNKIWTWSAWLKRGTIGDGGTTYISKTSLFEAPSSGSTFDSIYIKNADAIVWYFATGGATTGYLESTALFRDPSAWYHLVFVYDSTQATDSNRMKVYVNGSQIAVTSAQYVAQNTNSRINSAVVHKIGAFDADSRYADCYLTEINFIDGQALTPASFGVTDSVTGVWNPIRYSGTYGNNGFYLNFKDPTSTTTIGYDYSGNSNNWTANNISVTAGTTYDSMVDVPIGYGSDTGVGGELRGNYAVLNAVDAATAPSDGNLRLVTGNANYGARSTIQLPSSGKWYSECILGTTTSSNVGLQFGFATASAAMTNGPSTSGKYGIYADTSGYIFSNTTTITSGLGVFSSGTVLQIAYDGATGNAWVGKANVWYNSSGGTTGNPATGANPTFTSLSSVFVYVQGINGTQYFNAGQTAFSYTAPSGFKALCTQNLTAPTISNGANYFAATLYTGTGATQTVSNAVNSISFQPDWVWIKSRSAATNNKLTDSVRGATKAVISNTNGAETTDTNGLTAFGSSGFTVGTDTVYNNSGATYVGWNWKGGGTAVTNTSGTVNSSVSANTTAGFSVVGFTMTGSTITVGHGLGAIPAMMFMRSRDDAYNWDVWHNSLTNALTAPNYRLILNDTSAQSVATSWNSTPPTSSVFTVKGDEFGASSKIIAYCFASITGYSAFGSYTGNGSTDGPFVFTGMRPRWLMVKAYSGGTGEWPLIDSSRGAYNVASPELYASLTQADTSSNMFDLLSNGFKSRSTNANCNASGVLYIYAAFAENPFNISRAR